MKQLLLAAAAAGAALWWATSGTISMDSHKLPNALEAMLPPHHRSTETWRHAAGLGGDRFDNPWPTWEERGFGEVLRWNRERRK